ncbi:MULTISPECIES: pantoate--beta-alanine ligase [Sphingobium]|uniref:pantoate--beta-alanine ligase n=1 Tax=Sphingobium TaxID=165695 RepID=UPI0015EB9D7A|nr:MULTISPECIES: pantoate--beta-alanine ligase [Sphingobium]MCW2363040.1 pantoate--beta-alanine ligase [Sphingobium sp. B10D3B]MCW2400280.1 pantoate--beta-alanine ligase [Sphingobium sp. B10D7B]MCW2407258.1 pantoate--beta-alanine ligase [Sphingobium xanthum]
MQIFRDLPSLRTGLASLRADAGRIAFVPTMGALHAGHMALIAQARRRASHVVASIFVNPTQFGPHEDLSAYPRREESDAAMLAQAGVAALWLPDVATMYPAGFTSHVNVDGLSARLDGEWRPGHFEGVATVVTKLFNQVRPDIACFGEKDYQQLAIIRRMTRDLDLGVEIVGVETQRDHDGLALSSRNAYLTADQRARAAALPETLVGAGEGISAGEDVAAVQAWAIRYLLDSGFDSVDYFLLSDADTLEPMTRLDRPARLLVAARIGSTRLIDNIPIHP